LAFINHWAASVFGEGTVNFLKWCQLWTHPTLSITWKTSYANKIGHLCQGIGIGSNAGKQVKGINTFFPIQYNKISVECRRKVASSKVVCKVQPENGNTVDQTCITIGGNNIAYPSDVSIPTDSIKLVKLLINSVLSQCNA
jgi:hypothetical protein